MKKNMLAVVAAISFAAGYMFVVFCGVAFIK